ncbi:MAG: type I restriction-modification enzyme R subunit C-terminal domain-containing protein [Bacteroidia bacterium]
MSSNPYQLTFTLKQQDFEQFMREHKDEITALRIFYDQPYERRNITYRMITELRDVLLRERSALGPMHVWQAYEQLEKVNGQRHWWHW